MGLEILNRFLAEEELSLASFNRLESLHPSQSRRAPVPKTRPIRLGSKPPAPEPTIEQAKTLMSMYVMGRTQVSIAEALNVPRSTIRIWYKRRGFEPLLRLEGHMIGRADARARAAL